jgi:hypothetical protein
MPNEHENDPKSTAKDEAITKRVQELRGELEQLGRWGIVTWCDEDIATALERAGAHVSPANLKAVREHFLVEQIDDRMTEVGFDLIEEAIGYLGLATRSDSGGEASGAKTRD